MAILRYENHQQTSDLTTIQKELSLLGVELKKWSLGENPELLAILKKTQLSDEEKQMVLEGLDHYFQQLKTESGYQDRDLIVLSDLTPGLDEMLKKFDRCHTHDDDEVRFIIDGEGTFGFVVANSGSQITLTVEAGEFINVPKDTEHWFVLTEKKRVKAIRYFTGTEGWVPVYTDTPRKL